MKIKGKLKYNGHCSVIKSIGDIGQLNEESLSFNE